MVAGSNRQYIKRLEDVILQLHAAMDAGKGDLDQAFKELDSALKALGAMNAVVKAIHARRGKVRNRPRDKNKKRPPR